MNESGSRFLPEPPDKKPANQQVDLGFMKPKTEKLTEPAQASDLQNRNHKFISFEAARFVVIYYRSNRKLIQWPIIYSLLIMINYYFLSFSDWMIIIFENKFFEVLIYEAKFDMCNEWD